jgi:AcrR family transcriptional regulator
MAERDAERTRNAILTTAEALFARHGFAETSLQQIGEAAGFARSTPGYFFRSKQALYDAVLRRALERGRDAMEPAFAAAAVADSPAEALDVIVGRLIDFLAGDPDYVRLLQREALAEGPSLPTVLGEDALEEMRRGLRGAIGAADVDHVFLELFSLCWFPLAHSRTLVAALGLDAHDRAFLDRHRERIVGLFAPPAPR